jgi:hypothetical protein
LRSSGGRASRAAAADGPLVLSDRPTAYRFALRLDDNDIGSRGPKDALRRTGPGEWSTLPEGLSADGRKKGAGGKMGRTGAPPRHSHARSTFQQKSGPGKFWAGRTFWATAAGALQERRRRVRARCGWERLMGFCSALTFRAGRLALQSLCISEAGTKPELTRVYHGSTASEREDK